MDRCRVYLINNMVGLIGSYFPLGSLSGLSRPVSAFNLWYFHCLFTAEPVHHYASTRYYKAGNRYYGR